MRLLKLLVGLIPAVVFFLFFFSFNMAFQSVVGLIPNTASASFPSVVRLSLSSSSPPAPASGFFYACYSLPASLPPSPHPSFFSHARYVFSFCRALLHPAFFFLPLPSPRCALYYVAFRALFAFGRKLKSAWVSDS